MSEKFRQNLIEADERVYRAEKARDVLREKIAQASCPFHVNQIVTKNGVDVKITTIDWRPSPPFYACFGLDDKMRQHRVDETWTQIESEITF